MGTRMRRETFNTRTLLGNSAKPSFLLGPRGRSKDSRQARARVSPDQGRDLTITRSGSSSTCRASLVRSRRIWCQIPSFASRLIAELATNK
ncbi:Acetyl-CoA carboxylase [Fusarium oxysporum f. sp. albedinis]|nr:Acetyl-CoA carboxylase [Fusarium oxysporum f. sp. albedinis]